jgi:hypothetical protein
LKEAAHFQIYFDTLNLCSLSLSLSLSVSVCLSVSLSLSLFSFDRVSLCTLGWP